MNLCQKLRTSLGVLFITLFVMARLPMRQVVEP